MQNYSTLPCVHVLSWWCWCLSMHLWQLVYFPRRYPHRLPDTGTCTGPENKHKLHYQIQVIAVTYTTDTLTSVVTILNVLILITHRKHSHWDALSILTEGFIKHSHWWYIKYTHCWYTTHLHLWFRKHAHYSTHKALRLRTRFAHTEVHRPKVHTLMIHKILKYSH